MTATLATTRPTIDRAGLAGMEARFGPDHPSVVRAREHPAAWKGALAEHRKRNDEAVARVDAERAARSAQL